ncbi:MAG: ribosomal protein S18-alanine N-acetyltransferase [Chloroflexi bacterium]|nr:ribosomal protein S18-alanine N-acetyltransferase [Chloroflexota bacterium]
MMEPADIAAAAAVERACFDSGWPATAFERELLHNGAARYIVLDDLGGAGIVGFAGAWLMLDEAHVVTVAVLPGERRHGYGRLLVQGLLDLARALGMTSATLECRVSNAGARALYRGFGFHEVGFRKRYYSDNGEDATIMTTGAFDSAAFEARDARSRENLAARFPGVVLAVPEAVEPA